MKLLFLYVFPLLLLGLAVGFINGMLGAGGGILLIYGLQRLCKRVADKRSVFATAIAVILPLSCVSVTHYFRHGSPDINTLGWLVIPAILGGALGALLLRRLSPRVLSRIFAAVVLISGVIMVL